MKATNIAKIFMVALPLMVALDMVFSVAYAQEPGFVHNASGKFTRTGAGGCLHTKRWKAVMGECGEGLTAVPAAAPAAPAAGATTPAVTTVTATGDVDGDGVAAANDKCPGTPKGVSVNQDGCPTDSDGDGVVDHEDACPGTPKGNEVDPRGCEGSAQISVSPVYFDFDRTTLKTKSTAILDEAAEQINRSASRVKSVMVTGHTDNTGPEAYNQALSERRANAVKDYLEGKGVTGVTARGAGESSPIGDNSTRAGRAANRRVEIDVNM